MHSYINRLKRDMSIYIVSNFVICIVFMVLLVRLLCIGGLGGYTIIIIVLLVGMLIVFLNFCIKYIRNNKKESFLKLNGIRIKATVDRKELKIGGNNIRHICYMVAYYTQNDKTYIYRDSVSDFNSRFVSDMKVIKEKGVVPSKIDVLVDPNDYTSYVVLKYDYLCQMYQLNSELMDLF